MYTGNCPDALTNVRPVDLNVSQMANLLTVWPAAHAAIGFLYMMVDSDGLDYEECDLPDCPLWMIVRWYVHHPRFDSDALS